MARTSVFTTITPLPSTISRETALEALADHVLMIDLNPLVIERKLVAKAPHFAPAEEFGCKWYLITDRISYMPGRLMTSKVDYYACFHDLPGGLQTHCYAPMGLDIRSRWSVGGSLPGESRENAELGLGIPKEGLYLREDVTMKCNMMLTSFVKKTFLKAHERLVERLSEKAHVDSTHKYNSAVASASRHSGSAFSGTLRTGGSSSSPSVVSSHPASPPLAQASPRFSGPIPGRPETPASHASYYGSPAMAAQPSLPSQDANPAFISPLYNHVDPAYRAANPYDNAAAAAAAAVGAPFLVHGHVAGGLEYAGYQTFPEAAHYPPLPGAQTLHAPPPPPAQTHADAVEIASSELKHPTQRDDKSGCLCAHSRQQSDAAVVPRLPPRPSEPPAELEG